MVLCILCRALGIIDTDHLCAISDDHTIKHQTLTQCWFTVGPVSVTVDQHYFSSDSISTVHCTLVRLCADNKLTLEQCFLFALVGYPYTIHTLGRMFVIGVVHTKCSKLFKGLDFPMLSMVLSTIKNP